MKCAIMQPTYLPWAGYFSLISQVDHFVFLDDVQYEKGTWQSRNRVLVGGSPVWLSVPTNREFLGQAINQVTIEDRQNWRRKHFSLLSQAYARHPHVREMLKAAELILNPELKNLADLNIQLIKELSAGVGIDTQFHRSGELPARGGRTQRLINICEHLKCDEYLAPVGSAEYLKEDAFVEKTTIRLSFNAFVALPYAQLGGHPFISHLSLLDVIANLGWSGASSYVRCLQ